MKSEPKIFYYHQRSFYCELFFFTILIPVLILFWSTTLYAYYLDGLLHLQALRSSVCLTISLLASIGLYRYLRTEMSKKVIGIETDRLIKKSSRTIQFVSIEDIDSIGLLYIPFIKGFIILKTKKKQYISIPLFIRNCSALLEQLRINIQNKHNCSVNLTDEQWKKLKKAAYQHDISRKRHFKTLFPLITISTVFALGGLITASKYWGLTLLPALLFGLSSIVFPIGAYLITDYHLTMKNSDTKENSELLLSLFITIMLYMVTGIFLNYNYL